MTQFDEVTHEVSVNILHEYYSNEVSSKAVLDVRSAVPWKKKRTVLTQEYTDTEGLRLTFAMEGSMQTCRGVFNEDAVLGLH